MARDRRSSRVPYFHVYLTAATLSIANATNTNVLWDASDKDPWGLWNAAAKDQLIIPNGWGGIWDFYLYLNWTANADALRRLASITLNAGLTNGNAVPNINSGATGTGVEASGPLIVAGGDIVRGLARQDSGGAQTLIGSASTFSTHFWGIFRTPA